jgi:hypothetical protein
VEASRRRVDRRWYVAAVLLSVVAMIFAAISMFQPRAGYPLTFMFTMYAVIALGVPAWDLKPEHRLKLVLKDGFLFLIQLSILYVGMISIKG